MQNEFRECSHRSVENLLSSSFLSKNIKMKVYRILPIVLYGCGIWSLTFREERRLRVFENRVLRRIFEPKRYEVTRIGQCMSCFYSRRSERGYAALVSYISH